MYRVSRSALALCAAAAFACSKGSSTPVDAGHACQLASDCTGTEVCVAKQCVPICHATADCASQGTGLVCEEGICKQPACNSNAECNAGGGSTQSCIAGACKSNVAASDVASCEIAPSIADAHVGVALPFKVIALDSTGEALVFNNFTWTSSAGTIDAAGNLTTSAAGDLTVTASVTGSTKTCPATVHSYGAAANFRVTVINMETKEPIKGAKVVIDSSTTANATASDGTYSTTVAAGTHDVHVFAAGYNYTSYIQTNSTDLLVPLAPWVDTSLRSGFTSHMCDATKADDPVNGDPNCPTQGDFSPLQDQGQAVHLAFFGSSISNSLLDLSVDTLVGPLHSVTISIAGTTKPVNLPWGLVLGIGSDFFGTNDYRVFADPGVRATWGIGGNLNLSTVVGIITPLLSGGNGNIDIGTLLPQLIGFFGQMQSGAVVGVTPPANAAAGGTPTFDNTKPIPLDTTMRLSVNTTSPTLPQLDGAYVDGVLAIVGSQDWPIGFIPHGVAAGLSAKDGHGGVLDPSCDTSAGTAPCDTNKIPIKFAPQSGGAEGTKLGVVLLAVNFGGLSPGSSTKLALTAQVKEVDTIPYTKPGDTPPAITVPDFIPFAASSSITVTKATRTVALPADTHPQIYRFEVENGARVTWNVWMPPTGTGSFAGGHLVLPDPSTFNDSGSTAIVNPFLDAVGDDGKTHGASARLLSLQLAGSPTPDSLESFGALRLDELGASLTAFSALQVDMQ